MCKAASTIGRIGSGVFTLGASEIARNNLGKDNFVSKVLQTPGTILTGGASKFGVTLGGSSYTPQMLAQEDPKLLLARTGGAPLLAQIAMGVDVEDALAGYFGRTKGADWEAYKGNLSPDERAAIDGVKTQLTEIQSNAKMRDQAVQQVIKDFPNITATAAQKSVAAKQQSGEDFDSTTKQYIDLALGRNDARFAANGGLSSGAYAAATARAGAEIGMDKLNYVSGREDTAYQEGSMEDANTNNWNLTNWNARYTEANALRNFQNKMMGQGAALGFSADQAALDRRARVDEFNTGAANDKMRYEQQTSDAQDNALFGAAGNLAGTAAMAYFMGPAAGGAQMAMSGMGGAKDYGFSGPATPGYQRNNVRNWG